MSLNIQATPRPDILLTLADSMQNSADKFISTRVLPYFATAVSTGAVPKFIRNSKIERLYKPRYGSFSRGDSVVEQGDTFNCEEQGFELPYDHKDVEIYGDEDKCVRGMGAMVLDKTALAHEAAVASQLMNETTFSGQVTTVDNAWTESSSTPRKDVASAAYTASRRVGVAQNDMSVVLSAGLYNDLLNNDTIQANFRALGTNTRRADLNRWIEPTELAQYLGVREVLVGNATYDTAEEGQDAVYANVWSDDYCLVAYLGDESETDMTPGLGKTFLWDDPMEVDSETRPAGMEGNLRGMTLETYGDVTTRTSIVRARHSLDPLLFNKIAGQLLAGV